MKGEQGPTGPTGMKGDTGDIGPSGLKGDPGTTGQIGPTGGFTGCYNVYCNECIIGPVFGQEIDQTVEVSFLDSTNGDICAILTDSILEKGHWKKIVSTDDVNTKKVIVNNLNKQGIQQICLNEIGSSVLLIWDGTDWIVCMCKDVEIKDIQELFNERLLLGGIFSDLGRDPDPGNVAPINNVGSWDGAAFESVNNSIVDPLDVVLKMTYSRDGLLLYLAANDFPNNVGKLICWDGTNVKIVGTFNGIVYDVLIGLDDSIYVAGDFTQSEDIDGDIQTAKGVARFAEEQWEPLANGFNNTVFSLVQDSNGDLYAGGKFRLADGSSSNQVAKFDGTDWSNFDDLTFSGRPDAQIKKLAIFSGYLYAGVSADDLIDTNVYRTLLTGPLWSTVGTTGVVGVNDLLIITEDCIFAAINPKNSGLSIALQWDGSSWNDLLVPASPNNI
jgi:hypothetical protein